MCVWQALIHGLNRHYYSIAISYRKNELEERMLMNLQKKAWTHGLTLKCATLYTVSAAAVNVCPFMRSANRCFAHLAASPAGRHSTHVVCKEKAVA